MRVSMRTAADYQVTSLGTFLSSLCHEFCHCLDHRRFGFRGERRREDQRRRSTTKYDLQGISSSSHFSTSGGILPSRSPANAFTAFRASPSG